MKYRLFYSELADLYDIISNRECKYPDFTLDNNTI